MKLRVILMLLAVVLLCSSLPGQEAAFAKDPAISPDGNEVCFVYDGDLWIVSFKGGIARRLTETKANEWAPLWSPDGKWIAFNSNREGRTYAYLIPSKGGESRVIFRETYSVVDWFNDSQNLLVTGYNFEFGRSMYKLPISGERPTLVADIGDVWASLSPDNKQIVFNRYGDAHRESYTGSLNGDLYLYDIESATYSRLTKTNYTERYPVFSHFSNSLFYAASDGDNYQIMRVEDLDFDLIFKTSDLPRFSARDLSIARDNDRIVFEHFDAIYKYDPTKLSSPKIEKLQIDLASDLWADPFKEFKMKDEISDYAISDDGKLVAFNYKYDNFVAPVKGAEPIALTNDHSGWAKVEFLNDREMVLFKQEHGKETLFRTTVDPEIELEPIKWFGADSLNVSDINRDAYGRWQIRYADYINSGRIAIADSNFTNIRPLEIPEFVISNFSINKSGTHAAYTTISDEHYVRNLYIYDFATKEHRKVLSDQSNISDIFWSEDNRSLIFTRARNLYRLDLVPRDEFEYEEDHWKEIFDPEIAKAMADSTTAEADSTALEEADEPQIDEDGFYVMEIKIEPEEDSSKEKPVEIVWEGIDKRMYQLYQGEMSNLFLIKVLSDSTFLYLDLPWFGQAKASLKKGDIYGKSKKEEASFSKDSNSFKLYQDKLYFLDKSALKVHDLIGGQRTDIPIELNYRYNEQILNLRVFEQVWSYFKQNFYDPNMHGLDWDKLYKEYLPYVEDAADLDVVAGIIDEMIGDLNASHTAFYPRKDEESTYKEQAYLGFELDYSERLKKGIRISRVYPNTREYGLYKIREGSILTSLDSVEISPSTPIDSLLIDKVGKALKFTVLQDKEEIAGQLLGRSGKDARAMWYEYKIERNKRKVEQATGGKVGYIHVPAMGTTNYDDFYRDYFKDNADKDAVILDFRGNVGGRIHDDIISLLIREPYAFSTRRAYGTLPRVEPRSAIYVPTIVLVDEHSFSDGEIFPIIYQQLRLGKVIGFPSSGAVIGTRQMNLLDGSSMRMPGTGWYKVDGSNMEGTGAMPDIIVEHSLNDIISNNDKQLQRAIEEIVKELR
jgi:C-terminal processing protease CtpA/Prc/Tol biopolymer transport system component